jgi:hypothetical protein
VSILIQRNMTIECLVVILGNRFHDVKCHEAPLSTNDKTAKTVRSVSPGIFVLHNSLAMAITVFSVPSCNSCCSAYHARAFKCVFIIFVSILVSLTTNYANDQTLSAEHRLHTLGKRHRWCLIHDSSSVKPDSLIASSGAYTIFI